MATETKTLRVEQLGCNDISINGIRIAKDVFEDEKVDYQLVEREEMIDDLIRWIAECDLSRQQDKNLIKKDLKYLFSIEDKYVFSSIQTNKYIAASDKPERFKEIAKDILVANGMSDKDSAKALG